MADPRGRGGDEAAAAPSMKPLAVARRLLDVSTPRWSEVDWWRAGRVAVGVVVPFGIGAATGHEDYGAFAALGALPAGFVSFQGSSRSRLSAIGLASLGMATSTFVGSLAAAYALWSLVPVVVLLAYVCGLAVSLDQRLSVAALQIAVALEISVSVPLGPGPAGMRAALVLAGGLFQGALVLATWVVSPGTAERRALAASYSALAVYARALSGGGTGPPAPSTFPARALLQDPNPLLGPATRMGLVDLLEEAERLRASLAALAGLPETVADQGGMQELYQTAGQLLEDMASTLVSPSRQRGPRLDMLRARASEVQVPIGPAWRWLAEALVGQLRAVSRTIERLDAEEMSVTATTPALSQPAALRQPVLRQDARTGPLGTLRANVTTTTEAGRHALRMAVACGAAEAVVLGTGLAEGRWVVLTVFIVLKPDYATTLYRGAQRAVGTALGAGLGVGAVYFGHLGPVEMMIAAGLAVGIAYAIFSVSYLFYSVALTAFVVLLLDVLGTPAGPTAWERLLNTAIGAAVALVAFAVWPTWEGQAGNEKLARLLEAHSIYLVALLACFGPSPSIDLARLRRLQLRARRARSDAEASAQRLAHEQAKARFAPDIAIAVTAGVRRLTSAELAMHAMADRSVAFGGRGQALSAPWPPEALTAYSEGVQRSLEDMASAVRFGRRPEVVSLRPAYDALTSGSSPQDPMRVIADSVVDVLGTLNAVLCKGFPAPAPNRPEGGP